MKSFDEFNRDIESRSRYWTVDESHFAKEMYEEGAQSKQAEIDELRKRIDKVETLISTWNSEHDELRRCKDSNANCLSVCIDELSEALKGDQS